MLIVKVIDNSGQATDFELEEAPSILTAFENAGYQYPHGCRIGVCGSCISEVLEGASLLPPPDFIENRRLEELRAADRKTGDTSLDPEHIRFCCRTALTAPISLRPISGTVKKVK